MAQEQAKYDQNMDSPAHKDFGMHLEESKENEKSLKKPIRGLRR